MFLINGEPSDNIAVTNRGLHYGDGVFETLALLEKQPLCWTDHYQRLHRGCDRLGIDCPHEEILLSDIDCLPIHNGLMVLKVIITRGTGGRGYRPPPRGTDPCRIVGIYPWPDYPESYRSVGIRSRFCDTRLSRNSTLAGIKHLNRLEQIIARNEWQDDEITEGLMLDTEDQLIESTMCNLFLIEGDKIKTPDLTTSGIEGIIRKHILDIASEVSLSPVVLNIQKQELFTADEVFLCNSIIGIWPISEVDGQRLKSGPKTDEIRQLLKKNQIIVE